MSSLRISLFGGIIPRLGDRGLPDNAAQFAMNAKLYSGELRAWNKPKLLGAVPSGTKTVHHYRYLGVDKYLAFSTYTNVVRAPLINEQLGRIYWTPAAGGGMVNTAARIDAAQPAYKLGVPSPGGTFTATPSGGTTATAETRVYLATLVTNWGEESAPSSTVTVSGNADGTWTINGLDTLTADTANYPNISHLRLYRTLTSATGVDYRRVNEWAIGARPASYVDNIAATDLADNPVLESLGWGLPPSDLKGLIAVAGGFMAGYSGRTVRLSVPYQPHAWPEDFAFAVEDDIVGLGTFGNTIVICTQGRGYLLIGPSPDAMSLAKMESVQPCLSARSIVSTIGAVIYASTDGLVAVEAASNQGRIISRPWVTKDEWMARFSPATQMASIYQDRYFAFYNDQLGFTIGFDDPVTGFTELQLAGVTSVDLDSLTGQTLVTVGTSVYEWDGDTTNTLLYVWESKPFVVPKPLNFGAIQVRADFIGSIDVPDPPAQGIEGYALNDLMIGGGKQPGTPPMVLGGSINGPPAWLALGEPVTPVDTEGVAVKVYGDGFLRWFRTVTSEAPLRLPSGFKAATWEIEVQGSSSIHSITLASTMKELEQVP